MTIKPHTEPKKPKYPILLASAAAVAVGLASCRQENVRLGGQVAPRDEVEMQHMPGAPLPIPNHDK